jgi:hypothetical protein
MKTKWPGLFTLGVFLGITIICFLSWVLFVTLVWGILELLKARIDLFLVIEALSTALAAAAVFGAGFIAYRELSEVANSRYIDIADRLFEELNSKENVEARRIIFQNLPSNPDEGLRTIGDKERDAMKKVLNSLDRVAFLTQKDWIPDDIIMPWMHPMIAKSWEKLGPYIRHERSRRNEPYYYRYAEKLVERCAKWRIRNSENDKINWIENAL